jgi:hypothetical protein
LDGRLRPAMMLDPSPRLLVELSPIVAALVRAAWACKLREGADGCLCTRCEQITDFCCQPTFSMIQIIR